MRGLKQLLAGASLGLMLLACSNTTEPASDPSLVESAVAMGRNGATLPEVIVVKPGAPPLATTHASFWAVQGRRTGVTIMYRATAGQIAGEPFLNFTVPARAQLVDPSGRALARGDSILIEVHVVPGQLAARFSPEGLTFTGRASAQLGISIAHGRLPVVPARQLAIWYQPCDGGAWEKQQSHINRRDGMVVGDISHFSNYAVAY